MIWAPSVLGLTWGWAVTPCCPQGMLLFVLFISPDGMLCSTFQKVSDKLTTKRSFVGSLWGRKEPSGPGRAGLSEAAPRECAGPPLTWCCRAGCAGL